jgi:tRNA(fMet)-specific endonuclease VapC
LPAPSRDLGFKDRDGFVEAFQFGRFKATLRREGRPIGDIDLFIAGVAVCYGLTVVTNNTGHFERLPNLTLENWLEPFQGIS